MNEMTRTAAASCSARPGQPCEFGPPESFPDRSGRVGDVSVVRCRHCGIGITNPPLSDVAFLYEGRESQDFQPLSTGVARTIKDIAFHLSTTITMSLSALAIVIKVIFNVLMAASHHHLHHQREEEDDDKIQNHLQNPLIKEELTLTDSAKL